MSRQKVPDNKRQRIAQACDSCKRRKQKCNGQTPCLTCTKKRLTCTYSLSPAPVRGAADNCRSPPSKHGLDLASPCSGSNSSQPGRRPLRPRTWGRKKGMSVELETSFLSSNASGLGTGASVAGTGSSNAPCMGAQLRLNDLYGGSTTAEQDEEALFEPTTRMLQDQTGHLLYIGDSATLSYLHLLRIIVESVSGHSPFTMDPHKGHLAETAVSLPSYLQLPCMLADRETADVLVESFFTNASMCGMLNVFDRHDFQASLDACYNDPLTASNQFICLLFLVCAIGLVMSTPETGTPEEVVVRRLRSMPYDQAELFFRSAKSLGDQLNGFNNADLWSLQALCLIVLYMLVVSRWNAAYVYHGMAVRSAISLGLHRQEANAIFQGSQKTTREGLWKTLYILDRFLSASLGRSMAIHDDECSVDGPHDTFEPHIPPILTQTTAPGFDAHALGIKTTMHTCHIMGMILRSVYAKRRVSTKVTQDIVVQCGIWTRKLNQNLQWQRRPTVGFGRVARANHIAALHVNLMYCHSVILFTRPFFLFLMQNNRSRENIATPQLRSRTETFSEVCVAAAYHTVGMISDALDAGFLPQRNPFILQFLFTAALLVMSNEFVALVRHPHASTRMAQAMSIMEYFAQADPQADRLLWTLCALKDVVNKKAVESTAGGQDHRPFRHEVSATFLNGTVDPIEAFFTVPGVASHPTNPSRNSMSGLGRMGPQVPISSQDGGLPPAGSLHPPGTAVRHEGLSLQQQQQSDMVFLSRQNSFSSAGSQTTSIGSSCLLGSGGGSLLDMTPTSLSAASNGTNHRVLLPKSMSVGRSPSLQPLPTVPMPSAPRPQLQSDQSASSYAFRHGPTITNASTGSLSSAEILGSEGDGFDFTCLWDWPGAAGEVSVVDDARPADESANAAGIIKTETTIEMGPAPSIQSRGPMYAPLTMSADGFGANTGTDMDGPDRAGVPSSAINGSLYITANFG